MAISSHIAPQEITLAQWLLNARERLSETRHADTAGLDAELLAGHALELSRAAIYAFPEKTLNPLLYASLEQLLHRRLAGEPIAYIMGKREFWSTELSVAPGVLVPRPETETLVEVALARAPSLPEGDILDLGTGSAAIAIAMAQELPNRTVIAIEREFTALCIAAANIENERCNNLFLVAADWMNCLESGSASLIMANPPYLANDDEHLESLAFEPETALVSGPTGLEDLNHIIEQSRRVAKPGALIILEHGFNQASAVRELFRVNRYEKILTINDLAGLDRVTLAYMPEFIP